MNQERLEKVSRELQSRFEASAPDPELAFEKWQMSHKPVAKRKRPLYIAVGVLISTGILVFGFFYFNLLPGLLGKKSLETASVEALDRKIVPASELDINKKYVFRVGGKVETVAGNQIDMEPGSLFQVLDFKSSSIGITLFSGILRVKNDTKKQFQNLTYCGNIEILEIGTSYEVASSAGKVSVSVFEGQVSVKVPGNPSPVFLSQGQSGEWDTFSKSQAKGANKDTDSIGANAKPSEASKRFFASEKIILMDGEILSGRITRQNSNEVILDTGTQVRTIKKQDIYDIEYLKK